jgi:hypothetical protein
MRKFFRKHKQKFVAIVAGIIILAMVGSSIALFFV